MSKLFTLCLPFLLISFAAQAGPFTRARTEGHRLDKSPPVTVEDVYVYSFLQEGAGNDRRLSKDLRKYLEVVVSALKEKGIRVDSKDLPAGALTTDVTPRGVNGIAGFERVVDASAKTEASSIARRASDEKAGMKTGYRLLLLPDKVVRSTGMQWGSRAIKTGSGTFFTHGAQASGVPSYSFRVYWLLEDANDQPVAAGTTTGTLDIRGFPAKPMAEQMVAELEQLGIGWRAAAPK